MNYPLLPGEKYNQLKQKIDTLKSLEEWQGREMLLAIRALKSPYIYWGIWKTTYVPRVGKNGQNKPEKTLSSHLHLHFKLCEDRK